MAKRKAARATGRGKARRRKASARQARSRKASAARARSRKASARPARRKASARPVRRKAAPKRPRVRKAPAAQARKAATRRKALKRTAPAARKRTAPKASTRKAAARKAPAAAARKVPALNRERRIVRDEDIVPSPPSSLDLDRSASAARSGRRELSEKFHDHTETSPAITGGDIDADWESAYSVGDEAPGGDNPTPDQDIVDDIGKALGVQYRGQRGTEGRKEDQRP